MKTRPTVKALQWAFNVCMLLGVASCSGMLSLMNMHPETKAPPDWMLWVFVSFPVWFMVAMLIDGAMGARDE